MNTKVLIKTAFRSSLFVRTGMLFLFLITFAAVSAQKKPLPEWQSQYAVGLNKLAPHTYVWPYADASDIEKPGGYEQSPFYMSLNGKWKFHWVKNPDNRPKDFYQPSYYTGGWADINVPGNWERQGYGTAIYVNETYEFDDKMFNFKRTRRSFLMRRMKSAHTAARSKCLPTGKVVVWYCAAKV